MFIDREAERLMLEKLYSQPDAQFFVLYGRRRVGKTELLREFCKNKPHLFFTASLSSDGDLLAGFSQQINHSRFGKAPKGFVYTSWEEAFTVLADVPQHERPVIVLDEFTYLINGNRSIPSVLQKVWDSTLKSKNLMVILCGSYIGMMETEVLGYRSPLYGRRTGSLQLEPLSYTSASQFFPGIAVDIQFQNWAILGGMPYYLNAFSNENSLRENIQEIILEKTGLLFNEPLILLLEELREPRNYFSILRAIAQGNTRMNEIAQSANLGKASDISRYLDVLQQLNIIARHVPATEENPQKSKKGLYQINDHFLRFWFRYVFPYQERLDAGAASFVLKETVLPDLDHFCSTAFEKAAAQFVFQLAVHQKLNFFPERVGRWWSRSAEIDILALHRDKKQLLLGECKWTKQKIGPAVLKQLQDKRSYLPAEFDNFETRYILFSKSGFLSELLEENQTKNVVLISLKEMFAPS